MANGNGFSTRQTRTTAVDLAKEWGKVIGAAALIFTAGVQYAIVSGHVNDTSIHLTTEEKVELIDSRIDEKVDLRLKRFERDLDAVRSDMRAVRTYVDREIGRREENRE